MFDFPSEYVQPCETISTNDVLDLPEPPVVVSSEIKIESLIVVMYSRTCSASGVKMRLGKSCWHKVIEQWAT